MVWLKVNPNYKEVNVEKVLADPDSLFYFYQKLIKLRQESIYAETLIDGSYQQLLEENQDSMAYFRIGSEKKVLVIANFRSEKINLELNYQIRKLILSNYTDGEGRLKAAQGKINYIFRPFETLVLEVE
ncbi:maltogenic amylase-like enzyme [Halanaerobium saccharolyticum]|uniref:Maltogenic amylase-like enzyme n=2 Tax=Halanaerobium saccharolyticum TaxID=43595 RepID=A0A4R7Z8X5_9FIRM|nr:maltogenic amylase-like enzyme [Halanaerobium saccharolyticum]TDW07570.1 maltogenic amylase-like enzyme [Halanaerobium saccharolyticum]TDX64491.1 maltogenic amylase-like enzyme [Halanaerobium saccharolyticum]